MAKKHDILPPLHWRYATKKFDSTQKIDDQTWAAIEESLVLTPSSFGLQPWKFLVIADQATKEKLQPLSWGQSQITDCSHLIVMCRRTDINEAFVTRFINRIAEVRQQNANDLEGYKNMILGFIQKMTDEQIAQWAAKQVYIALGQAMTVCAQLKVDTCPIEGFSAPGYDEALNLTEKNLASLVLLACGYRSADDQYAKEAKVRFQKGEVIDKI